MKTCKRCGTVFEGKFCPECGTKWEEPPAPEPVREQPASAPVSEPMPEQPTEQSVSEQVTPAPKQPAPVESTETEPPAQATSNKGGDIFDETEKKAPLPAQKSTSDKAVAVDDTPHAMDGEPVLWRAYKMVRWARSLTLFGAICFIVTLIIMLKGHQDFSFAKSFTYDVIAICVAAGAGIIAFFVPIKKWSPVSLLPYNDRRKQYQDVLDELDRLSKPVPNVSIQFGWITVDSIAWFLAGFPVVFCIVVIFFTDTFPNYSLIALTCGTGVPIGIALTLSARILKRREDELRMHFFGTKKYVAGTPWIRKFNEEKEIAFLNEYKKNKSAIANYPSSMVDVLPQTAKGVSALVLASLAAVYLCIHCAIFSPFRVYCLKAISFDRSTHTSDITAYLGDSDTKVISNQVIFVKSTTERTTVTLGYNNNDSYGTYKVVKIEYDCDYDEEKNGPAKHKMVVHREIVSGTKVFCGIPVKDRIVMECTYTDGSYRKMTIPMDDVRLEADMLLPNKFIFAIHDDWELQSFMHFDSAKKLTGKAYGVKYSMTTVNGKYASLVLSGGTVKDDDFRYRSVVEKLTIKKGITHDASAPYGKLYNLETVVVESGVRKMPEKAFEKCEKLKTIWCEDDTAPEDWNENWLGDSNVVVHWGGEWEYINGSPTLKPTEE